MFLLSNKLQKILKIQSNSNITFNVIDVFLFKSIEYQHCIFSTNGSISVDINIFWGVQFKEAPRAVGKWGPISEEFWISYSHFLKSDFKRILDFHFFGQRQKFKTQAS